MLTAEHIKMIALIIISYSWLTLEMKKRYNDQNKPYLPYLFSIAFIAIFSVLVGNIFGSPFQNTNLWITARSGIINMCFIHLITLIVFGIYKDLYKKNLPQLLYMTAQGLSALLALSALVIIIIDNPQITAIGAQAGLVGIIALFITALLISAVGIVMRIQKRA